ncbi:MAG: hypothetical protein K2L47_03205, partial [Clostridia bacterium]|nr:hypothetical protein [Clostridia bacterium]
MKKKITLILAVALIVLTSCMLLIGCTPSKPSDYMLKWNDSKNKSITLVGYEDYVNVETSEGVWEKKEGRTTTEISYIHSGDTYMVKSVEITNIKKDGKDSNTDTITPTEAIIYELKDGKYNVYYYELVWEKESASSDKIVKKGKWTAYQASVEDVEAGNDEIGEFSYIKGMFERQVESNKALAETFDEKYTKDGGKYVANDKINDCTQTLKVKSGELVGELTDSEGKVVMGSRLDLNEKITISSGAKDALKEYLNPDAYTHLRAHATVQ